MHSSCLLPHMYPHFSDRFGDLSFFSMRWQAVSLANRPEETSSYRMTRDRSSHSGSVWKIELAVSQASFHSLVSCSDSYSRWWLQMVREENVVRARFTCRSSCSSSSSCFHGSCRSSCPSSSSCFHGAVATAMSQRGGWQAGCLGPVCGRKKGFRSGMGDLGGVMAFCLPEGVTGQAEALRGFAFSNCQESAHWRNLAGHATSPGFSSRLQPPSLHSARTR